MSERLYNGIWDDIWNLPKYQKIRNEIKESFKDLVFDEGPHKYYLGDRELTCVSNITHLFKEHFDSDSKAEEMVEKYYDNPNHKYYHMSKEEILESWVANSKRATTEGTARHNFGESCFYFMIGQYDSILDEFKDRLRQDENGKYYMEAIYPKEIAVVKFWRDIPKCIVPIAAENKVFNVNDDYAYSGTFDILFYYDATLDNKDDSKSGCLIFDYKTNANLYNKFGKLLHPFEELDSMDLNVYKLQLTCYQMCLEKIGIKIIGRRIIWLLPDSTYQKIPLEEYCKLLDQGLKEKNII